MPHGVERQEVVLPDTVVLAEEFEAGFEDARLCVLERDSDTQHRTAIVMIEVYTFGDFTSGDAEQNSSSAVAARRAVRLKRQRRFLRVGGFDENELEFPDLVQDTHALPHADNGLHVEIRREENYDSVRSNFGKIH